MSRRRRAGTLSQLLAFLYASFANLALGGRHTPLEPLTNERPAPVMSKHWPVRLVPQLAVTVAIVALAAMAFFVLGPTPDASAAGSRFMW